MKTCYKKLVTSLFIITLSTLTMLPVFANGQNESEATDSTTITVSMWDAPSVEHNFIEAFMEKYPDITVEIVNIPADNYSQKLNTMMATDTSTDVVIAWEGDLKTFANSGKLVSLDSYISSTSEFPADSLIPAVKKLQDISGGETYGLPWCYAGEILYYNKDMFDIAGISYPDENWTWDDFTNAAKKLTIRKDGNVLQWGSDDITFGGIWYSLIGAAGDPVIGADGKMQIGAGAEKALQFQYDLVNSYKVAPAPSASSAGSDLFIAGRAAMTRAGSWMCSAYREIEEFGWDIAPLPKGERSYASLHTGFFAIPKTTEKKEAAWKFIEYCMSEEGQTMISKGYNNPSAITTFAEKGAYQVKGVMGPTNWSAFDLTAQFGEFGYVLAPAGLTGDLVKKFQAAVLGQVSIEQTLKESQQLIDSFE